jgi:opacity protein-like surface antigen
MQSTKGLNQVICRLAKIGVPVALTLIVAGAPALAEEGPDPGETGPVAAEKQSPAKTRPRGPYLTAELGGNWAGATNTSVTLSGFRLSGAAGYNFNRWIGLELETAYLYASKDDVRVSQVPILVNFVLRYESKWKWVPYASAGLGGIIVWGRDDDDSSTFGDGAYQLTAGVRRMLNEKMSVGASYKYLGFVASSLLIERRIGNHSVNLGLNWKF